MRFCSLNSQTDAAVDLALLSALLAGALRSEPLPGSPGVRVREDGSTPWGSLLSFCLALQVSHQGGTGPPLCCLSWGWGKAAREMTGTVMLAGRDGISQSPPQHLLRFSAGSWSRDSQCACQVLTTAEVSFPRSGGQGVGGAVGPPEALGRVLPAPPASGGSRRPLTCGHITPSLAPIFPWPASPRLSVSPRPVRAQFLCLEPPSSSVTSS